MIILQTNNNLNLPIEFQISNYPKIINTTTTLYNLEITKDILNNDDLFNEYLNCFSSHLNDYQNSIIIIDNDFPIANIKSNYQLIIINRPITKKQLEEMINENIDN